jgi:LysR family transcriptional regulator, regulator for bpeEF and oprC
MFDLREAQLFLDVLAAKSLRAAGTAAGVDPTTLGRSIDKLEARLGVQLLHRSTRTLYPTPLGEVFATKAKELIERARGVEQELADLSTSPRGRLRLSLCAGYTRARLLPLIAPWIAKKTDLNVELRFEDHPVDLGPGGIDIAIRVIPTTAADVISTRLESYDHVLVASPSWIAKHDKPSHPSELRTCVGFRSDRAWTRWQFRRDDERVEARVQPTVEVNDIDALVAITLAGAGMTVLPSYLADEHLRERTLVRLMSTWTLPPGAAYAVHARRRYLSGAAREFLAALAIRTRNRYGVVSTAICGSCASTTSLPTHAVSARRDVIREGGRSA